MPELTEYDAILGLPARDTTRYGKLARLGFAIDAGSCGKCINKIHRTSHDKFYRATS